MSEPCWIDGGLPALLEFRGPDAVRFLNGQLTQDVRLIEGGVVSLPSCVTDAKGRFQFRVRITEMNGAPWVEGPPGVSEALEARLTRYLIADDAEAVDLTGRWKLVHFPGSAPDAPEGVLVRKSARFNVPGIDWWIPAEMDVSIGFPKLEGDALESFRINNGIPLPGRELTEGLLPPEAGLDATDVSYQKGCYIGQEVISRIKYVGKVNKRLVRLCFDPGIEAVGLVDEAGRNAGGLTSVSPIASVEGRYALGFVKRGVETLFVEDSKGVRHSVTQVQDVLFFPGL